MTNWYWEALKKFWDFKGRARRKEFWIFFLITLIIAYLLTLIDLIMPGLTAREYAWGETSGGMLNTIFRLAILIPTIAVGVRRMHDTDRSGWWVLVPIVNLVFWVGKGTRGDNRFGPDPTAISEAD